MRASRPRVQREAAIEMEELGYGTLWYGESVGREAFVPASIFLQATSSLVVASGIANIWARDPMAMAAGGRSIAEAWPNRFILSAPALIRPLILSRIAATSPQATTASHIFPS